MSAPRAMLHVADEHGAWAVDTTAGIRFGSWRQGVMLEATGALAGELSRCLADGSLSGLTAARLEAAKELLGSDLDEVSRLLRSGAFRVASPADLVRRDGFGQLWVELGSACNLRCIHCYAGAGPDCSSALSRETLEGILEDAASLGFRQVQLTGGEPLLSAQLEPTVAKARSLELPVEVFTNGLGLTPPLLERLARRDVAFAFSVYGADEAVHERVTRIPGSWAATVDAAKRARGAGCRVRVAVVLMQENLQVAGETLRFAESLVDGPELVRCDVARGVGRGRFDPEVGLPAAEWAARAGPPRKRRLGKACVAADGTVYPCILSRWTPLGRVGQDGGLKEVLTSPRPSPRWKLPDGRPTQETCRERLTCLECQVTAELLSHYAHEAETS